jgi:chemotaxis protein MotA
MFLVLGLVVVVGCVLGGYAAAGGHLGVLFQPFEIVIIVGAALGAFITANATQPQVLKETIAAIGKLTGGQRYGKADYLELLCGLYVLFRIIKVQGPVALEPHVEKPAESAVLQQFPKLLANHEALDFLCDYLRLVVLGAKSAREIDAIMDEEIETMRAHKAHVTHAIQSIADGLPALGIVAAVLGVIHTMGAITEPPEVLGHSIGAALVGTFLGILIAYGFVAPMAEAVKGGGASELKYVECIRQGILAHLNGSAPQIAVEFARKVLPHDVRPSFKEVEGAVEAANTSMRKAA